MLAFGRTLIYVVEIEIEIEIKFWQMRKNLGNGTRHGYNGRLIGNHT